MSKSTKIVAGVVAGLGLAALPLGAFAAVTPVNVEDTLQLTVTESCSFSSGGTGLNLTDSIAVSTETTWDSSSHSFVIACNSNSYTVTAVATDLTKTGAVSTHGTIAYADNGAYATGLAAKGDDGKWTAVLTGGDTTPSTAAISKSSSTIKSGKATTTDNFSVAYKAYTGNAQEQGTYSGTVTYTLTGTSS